MLGGTQSLHTNSMDEALALPTDKAARIALRTQQIIAHETGAANVIDPLGGSWFIEELTDKLESEAEEMFAHIDAAGDGSMLEGAFRLIDEGWYQSGIADAAYEFEKKVNAGRRVVVGASAFTEGNEDDEIDLLKITNDDEQRQIKHLAQVRARPQPGRCRRRFDGAAPAPRRPTPTSCRTSSTPCAPGPPWAR